MKREPVQRKPAATKPAPMSREEAMSLAAAKADAEMTAANAKPMNLDMLAPEDWMHKGGRCGFKLNGYSVVRRRG